VRNHQVFQALYLEAAARQSAGLNGSVMPWTRTVRRNLPGARWLCGLRLGRQRPLRWRLRTATLLEERRTVTPGITRPAPAPTDQKQALTPAQMRPWRPEMRRLETVGAKPAAGPLRGRGKLCRNPIKRIVRHGLGSVALLNNPRLQDRILPLLVIRHYQFLSWRWLSKRSPPNVPLLFLDAKINRISDKRHLSILTSCHERQGMRRGLRDREEPE